MVYKVTHPQTGTPYTVSDEPLTNFEKAPPPYDLIAPYWLTSPFMSAPWNAFPVDPVRHDIKLEQFERVQGVFPQRRDWVAAGGAISDFIPGRSRYDQDYELFLGVATPDEQMAAALAAHQQMWSSYGLGVAGVYRFVNRRGTAEEQAERPEILNLFFENAPLPPPASRQTGRLKWRKEDVTAQKLTSGAVWANQLVSEYQEALIRGGIYVPKLHPHVPQGLQSRNATLAPKG